MLFGIRDTAEIPLWLGPNDLPIKRQQTVEFPEGQMKVVERYSKFVVE
jgi:hypothetical protein